MVRLGELELKRVSGGSFRLDGGSMFGVVPKVMWERHYPADDLNRIVMDTNCVLVKTPIATVLIDSGYGTKATVKERKRMAMADNNPLLDNLAQAEITPEDIDFVVLTHLHFDHVGGCTFRDGDGTLRPTFPHARHVVQDAEWKDATDNKPELRGAYAVEELQALAEAGVIQLVDGRRVITEGVVVEPTGGHTRGHQIVLLGEANDRAVYISELCPSTAHLRVFWTMAYDQDLLEVRRAKMRLLMQASTQGQLVLFNHDPNVAAARVQPKSNSEFAIEDTVSL